MLQGPREDGTGKGTQSTFSSATRLGPALSQLRHLFTIDTEIKAKRNIIISELITFKITKAKESVIRGGVSMWT